MPKKSVHVEQDGTADRAKLAVILQKALNSRQKDGSVVAVELGDEDDPSTITDWVSTGSTLLDLAISNRRKGGLPVGRIATINGLESTGKSLLCAHVIANTQKKGGQAVLIDPEYAAAPEFWTALGVNIKDLVYVPAPYLEALLQNIEDIVGECRKNAPDQLVTIITDSIASVPTKKEMECDYTDIGYNTDKSKLLSLALRRITGLIARQRILAVFTNQLRQNLKAMAFADPYVEPGGMGFQFASSTRIRLKAIGTIKNKDKEVIGRQVQAQVQKSRFGPSFRTAVFNVMFESGIQDLESWLDYMKDHGMISGNKAGYNMDCTKNKERMDVDGFVKAINNNPDFKEEVYNLICENYIMRYRDPNSKIATDTETVEEEEVGAKEKDKEPEVVEQEK